MSDYPDAKLVAAAVGSRKLYDKVSGHISTEELSPMGAFWWQLVQEWYKLDDKASSCDRDILKSRGERSVDPRQRDMLLTWFDNQVPSEVPSASNVVDEVLQIKRAGKGAELAGEILGKGKATTIRHLLAEYDQLLVATDLSSSKLQYAPDVHSLFDRIDNSQKIPLSPAALNERTKGGALPGSMIIIFGPKEVGKSLLAVSNTCDWLRAGKRVLYIGNEDAIDVMKLRVVQNLANMSEEQVREFKEEAGNRARAKGSEDRLFMVHLNPGTVAEIEELVVKHEPDCLVIDQIRNVGDGSGGKSEGMTSRMNQIAIDIRALSSKYGLVTMAVAQARASQDGKQATIWYGNQDIDSSRIGLAAQGDLIVGIGADEGMLQQNKRALSLPTNKLGGNHEGIVVTFDTVRNKVI